MAKHIATLSYTQATVHVWALVMLARLFSERILREHHAIRMTTQAIQGVAITAFMATERTETCACPRPDIRQH